MLNDCPHPCLLLMQKGKSRAGAFCLHLFVPVRKQHTPAQPERSSLFPAVRKWFCSKGEAKELGQDLPFPLAVPAFAAVLELSAASSAPATLTLLRAFPRWVLWLWH